MTSTTAVPQTIHALDSETCSTEKVYSGDSCAALAAKCGITPAEFTEYNPDPKLCLSLMPGQHVCCSSGNLPDFTPKPYANGTCFTYVVQPQVFSL